ncbi:class I SAM-dependent methyltransferase [Telluribacter sp.]|jgi:ubiquinone/menaquinone biosynthesis C-methylase UbiE|uniref:class I SAM-dependent methyltransferase n=1 Tax=Telluribacter sp. TaxID=1978767 RepID=UPI002E111F9D|nr:methyltransferase domain-containing protein [Telluribacter sp.]
MKFKSSKTKRKGHSEDFFGTYRDYWWNKGFLDLLAKRLELSRHHSLLDVGCGQCHWSRLLVNYMGTPAQVSGVDNDRKWAREEAAIKAYFEQKGVEFDLQKGDAHQLPYEDDSFDLVTCQTLLIHVEDPELVIEEMLRVLKPGGTILCVEPNNLVQSLTKSSISVDDPIDEILDHVKYALLFEKGKKKLGQGDNSVGDLVPGMLAEAGVENIDVRLSDKAIAMYPPYDTDEQIATMEQWRKGSSWSTEEFNDYDYFKAMGPEAFEFYEEYQRRYSNKGERIMRYINAHKYHAAGGALMYVVSGTKPD